MWYIGEFFTHLLRSNLLPSALGHPVVGFCWSPVTKVRDETLETRGASTSEGLESEEGVFPPGGTRHSGIQ